MIKTFKDLLVWQKAHALVLEIYKVTQNFPNEEKFGLTSQLRRAMISVPANVAEGFKKRSLNEKLHYFNISQSSLEETKYYLILSKDLGFLSDSKFEELADEVSRMLDALVISLKKSDATL